MNETTRLHIEWRHLDLGQSFCGHCSDTGVNLWEVITTLGQEHLLDGVELELENIILPPEQFEESNVVLINGVPVEEIVGTEVPFPGCTDCRDLDEEPCHVHRAPPGRENIFKAIPVALLRAAILKSLEQARPGFDT
ncbi:MAG: hypothetical protein BWY93_00031 [Euryarchaeota archaeon ADurb.BinA087]|nr:MAG: hypothetical protein BWY93_00031 [Euryarchaeota archaeon ADurb.BinA087]